ncbi:hypothetical protein ABIG06_003382 [Bradyrhizobium sp. USDA 326]|uniref:Uncharacterized protein n=1 Tax=Bradyrhizobium yuanmingense TaxID=108015 RepID=A0A1C3XET8_9BRAD|nr:hypothetical protein IQ15_06884 [Bradyrhizobium yuanmingense]SCB50782.1 hypothetical protein GA0061099_101324 [Bradyrhizobium yuanmingense]
MRRAMSDPFRTIAIAILPFRRATDGRRSQTTLVIAISAVLAQPITRRITRRRFRAASIRLI